MDSTYYDSGLASNGLRLLQPVSFCDRRLDFRLLRVQRGSKDPYTAVSCIWGDEEASEVIYIDKRPFRVRSNLWSCLYYLSQAARNAEWTYLWVDAICINQTDDAERSSQVRLMDQTYRDAVCVSVWLGLVPWPDHLPEIPAQMLPIKTLETSGFDFADLIIDLANRPYWSRVWVIQEFLLGRQVEIYCSDNRINWQDFQEMLSREAGIELYYDASNELFVDRNRISELPAVSLVMGRHLDKHPEFLLPLSDLLVDHCRAQCKDPRDKVFGLLGLITTEERYFLGRYFPDYAISEDHVRIITLAHLTQFPALSRMERRGGKINADSEEIFVGLGVVAKAQRKRLLKRAEMLDYLGGLSSHVLLQSLRFEDFKEECETVDAEGPEETRVSEPFRSYSRRWLRRSIQIGSALLVMWLIVRSMKMSNL
ncbi:hypothetical protein MMC25_004606 [Agyrium rufum]|nr:hypothetical protein [Agyrium rufum]